MTAYEKTHKETAALHYEGMSKRWVPVVIDVAEVAPGTDHPYEVAVLWPNGAEETKEAATVEEAKRLYEAFFKKYASPPRTPRKTRVLTGKYAKLRDDLRVALEAGRVAEMAEPGDGGTCNFDSAAICLPHWQPALVTQAAKEAGTNCSRWRAFKDTFTFRPDTGGQGFARTRNAEAMTKALCEMGYDATVYYQMD